MLTTPNFWKGPPMNQQTQAQLIAFALKIEETAAGITVARINKCPKELGDEDVRKVHVSSVETVRSTLRASVDMLEQLSSVRAPT